MAMLAELLTGATTRSALARRDIATVFGILRDAGVSHAVAYTHGLPPEPEPVTTDATLRCAA